MLNIISVKYNFLPMPYVKNVWCVHDTGGCG